ncbi:MAG: ABC transporter permease subunit [Pseudomonadota bacterium]
MSRAFTTARRRRAMVLATRFVSIAALIAVVEYLTRSGVISSIVLPPPSKIAATAWSVAFTPQFADDVATTSVEIAVALGIALSAGFVAGIFFWRLPLAGRIFEPFLAAIYSIPTMVFYPILLVAMGVNRGPIIVLAATLAFVPVTLNTMVALRSVPVELVKLSYSLNCSPLQRYRQVLLPAALPVIMSGAQISFVYCLIVTVAMEFLLATAGLGHRVAFEYNSFRSAEQWAAILAVLVLSVAAVTALNAITARVRRDMD